MTANQFIGAEDLGTAATTGRTGRGHRPGTAIRTTAASMWTRLSERRTAARARRDRAARQELSPQSARLRAEFDSKFM